MKPVLKLFIILYNKDPALFSILFIIFAATVMAVFCVSTVILIINLFGPWGTLMLLGAIWFVAYILKEEPYE